MKVYLVGGAVRDKLLGIPVKERDWVVVGATPEELLAQGYKPVGKDFPVFLHPDTHEEYALARTERKTGKGYTGFVFHADPSVSLEDDLKRRDLTINAMAEDENGKLVDPYHGRQDLENKCFRHVSDAFSEDPVRILRAARFAAKLPEFSVDPNTNQLMQDMVGNGEVDALVAERVWQEFQRALTEKNPCRFIDVLQDCGALAKLFPNLTPNGAGTQKLAGALTATQNPVIRFAILLHPLREEEITSLCSHYRAPTEYRDLARLVASNLQIYPSIAEQPAETILAFIKKTDALRRRERFQDFLIACELCAPSGGLNTWLINLVTKLKNSDTKALQERGLKGQDFAKALLELQTDIIDTHKF